MSNQRDRLLKLIQDKYGDDEHPILVMAEIAFNGEDAKLKLDAAKSIMPYIESQKKAVEVKGDLGANVGLLRVSMIDENPADSEDSE